MSPFRLLATAIAILSLAACDAGYECGILNHTIANGTVRDAAGATLATVQVDLSENIGPSFLRLSAGVTGSAGSGGAPLRGHVTRARLVTPNGDLIAEIPTGTSTLSADGVVALNVDLPTQTEYARVRGVLLSRAAKIVLETDLPGLEVITTTLPDAYDVPGDVQRCKPT